MSIITKAGSPIKGSATQFTLDKAALAAVASVAADSYYSDISNWAEVILNYKSSTGNQKESLKFNATQTSPTANFLVSEKARNIFQVYDIHIVDFDSGVFVVPRSSLNAVDFDVIFTQGPSVGSLLYSNTFTSSTGFDSLQGNAIISGGSLTITGAGLGQNNLLRYLEGSEFLAVNNPQQIVRLYLGTIGGGELRVGYHVNNYQSFIPVNSAALQAAKDASGYYDFVIDGLPASPNNLGIYWVGSSSSESIEILNMELYTAMT